MLVSAVRECMGAGYQAKATRRSKTGMHAGKRARTQHKQQCALAQGGRCRAKAHAHAAGQARGAMGGAARTLRN